MHINTHTHMVYIYIYIENISLYMFILIQMILYINILNVGDRNNFYDVYEFRGCTRQQ